MTIKERMCYHAFSSEAMVLQGVPWGCVYILRIFFQRGGKQGLSPLLSFFFFCSLIYLMYLFQTKNTHNLLTTHTHTHTTHEREREKETCYYHRIGVRPYHYVDDEERSRILSPVIIIIIIVIFFIFFV